MQRPEYEVIKLKDSLLFTGSCPSVCAPDCGSVCGPRDCQAECVPECRTDAGCPYW